MVEVEQRIIMVGLLAQAEVQVILEFQALPCKIEKLLLVEVVDFIKTKMVVMGVD